MINAIGLQNVGVRAFVAEKLPQLRSLRHTNVIANVFGRTISEYVEVIRILEGAKGLVAYELNISCPNVERGGVDFGTNPALTAEVVAAARKVSRDLFGSSYLQLLELLDLLQRRRNLPVQMPWSSRIPTLLCV